MRKLIVPCEKQEPLALVAKRVGKKWLGHRLDSGGDNGWDGMGYDGKPERHCQVDKQRRKLGLGLGLVWGLHMSRRFNFIERMTGTPTGNRTQEAGRRTQGHQAGHIHTCITTGGSSQLSTLHSANKFGLAKGVGWGGRCAGAMVLWKGYLWGITHWTITNCIKNGQRTRPAFFTCADWAHFTSRCSLI